MLDVFANYVPKTWFDEAGLSKGGRVQDEVRAKPERRWKNSAKAMSISLAAATALAIVSVLIPETVTASNLVDVAAPPGTSPIGHGPGRNATPGEVNSSFQELFAAFGDGVKLITNMQTLQLAEKAAARRNDRPEGWARKLASDVGDASD